MFKFGRRFACALVAASAVAVTATFALLPTITVVTSSVAGGSGTVTSDVGGIACPATKCSQFYELGTQVTLTALPSAPSVHVTCLASELVPGSCPMVASGLSQAARASAAAAAKARRKVVFKVIIDISPSHLSIL